MILDVPDSVVQFHLPRGVNERLQQLLDKQEEAPLTPEERREAEGLVELNDFLSLLKVKAERVAAS